MKKISIRFFFFLCAALSCSVAQAQLSGSYTVGGTTPDYATLSAAISDLNTLGVNGPVTFVIRDGNYSGTSWRGVINNVTGASATNTITFQSQGGNRANCVLESSGSSSANYVFRLNGSRYIRIKNMTLRNTSSSYGKIIELVGAASYNIIENCLMNGSTTSTTSTNMARIYADNVAAGSGNIFRNNQVERGSYGVYMRGSNTSVTSNGHVFEGNVFEQNYYYGMYGYYLGDITFTDNEVNRTGSGTYYGVALYYTANNLVVTDNVLNTSTTGTTYGTDFEFTNYYSNNPSAGLQMTGNVYNMFSSTNSVYPTYHYYGRNARYTNNTVNVTSSGSSGYIYAYYMYYDQNSRAEANTFNFDKAGGYIYARLLYYGANDSFTNNTVKMRGNCYSYNYTPYYSQNYYVTDNDIDIKTTNRTMYGAYIYQYSGTFARNRIQVEATSSGAAYGIMAYYQSGSKIYNNVVSVKATSTCYALAVYYNYSPTEYYNNTFYTAGTSSSNYGAYIYNTSSSYTATLRNNIFAKAGNNGTAMYVYNPGYVKSDFNLFSAPGGDIFQYSSTLYTDELQEWRTTTNLERNSLVYEAPFADAANGDFEIDVTSPAAWAVNGRGTHITNDTADFIGQPRPVDPANGVPDVGAYEITPTSTPPNAMAAPVNPVANSTQVFTFGQDTVATIDWGSTVPATYTMRQYTGIQAAGIPVGVGQMFFYTAGTPATWTHTNKPHLYYKNPWIGDIPSEGEAVIARSSNLGAWEGYNYTNASTDTVRNILTTVPTLDSIGSYTGVQNGRIGVRCVFNPLGLTISNVTAFKADVDWQAVFNPIGYQVVVKIKNVPPTAAEWAAAPLATSNTLTAANLTEDTKYFVFVRSVCGVGDTSGYSLDSFTTLITCHVPTVTVGSITDARVVASWNEIKTAIKYEYALTKSSTPPAFGTELSKTSVLTTYLDPGTEYFVHVRAHCNSIYSKSDWATVPFMTNWKLSVAEEENNTTTLGIYPNPASEHITVLLPSSPKGEGNIFVRDMAGKTIMSIPVLDRKTVLDVSALPAGVYTAHYSDENESLHEKFTKR